MQHVGVRGLRFPRWSGTLQIPLVAAASTLTLVLTVITPTAGDALLDLSTEQRSLVEWAEGRFALAELALPPILYAFHDTAESCASRRGLFHHASNLVEICGFEADTLIHELAHAWTETTLDDHAKHAFLALRGLETWNAAATPWELRGTEHAAEIIAWGVEERTRLVPSTDPLGCFAPRLLTIRDSSPDELIAGYVALTGQMPALRDPAEWLSPSTEMLSPEAIRIGSAPVTPTTVTTVSSCGRRPMPFFAAVSGGTGVLGGPAG
ncbi:hypothetical protein BH23ACT5_BH23ACT5_06270 [soil metagenome]